MDLLERTRARGAAFAHTVAHGTWGIDFPPSPGLAVHVLLDGAAVVVEEDGAVHPVAAGDAVLVRGDVVHRLASGTDAPGEALEAFTARHTTAVRRLVADGSGPAAAFMCGAYRYSGDLLSSLVAQLPPVLVVTPPLGSRLRAALDLLAREVTVDAPGQQTVLDRLLDVAVVGLLRAHLGGAGPLAPGWYRAREHPGIARALTAVHTDPARGWTVASLAQTADLSRAAFARRFVELVGAPPLEYVTGWRMAVAREQLRDTGEPIAAVARGVGYASEFAFAAAFKREHGVPPGRWRAAARAAVEPVAAAAGPGADQDRAQTRR